MYMAAAPALPGGPGRVLGIDLVGPAQTDELRTRGFECRHHLVAAPEAVMRHRLDAAGLEEILREGGACGEIGRPAEIGEEDLRSRSALGQDAVGSLAQTFERLGEAGAPR